jgi:hypothetical protein
MENAGIITICEFIAKGYQKFLNNFIGNDRYLYMLINKHPELKACCVKRKLGNSWKICITDKDEFIKTYNSLGIVRVYTNYDMWNYSSLHCYERNQECNGCMYSEFESFKCQMKHKVEQIIEFYGKPERLSEYV